jgi:hypothetical protein
VTETSPLGKGNFIFDSFPQNEKKVKRIILVFIGLGAGFFSLLLFVFIRELWRGPICELRLEAKPEGSFTLYVIRSNDSPFSRVCILADNRTQQNITYSSLRSDVRLERQWLKILWLPYYRLTSLLSLVTVELSKAPLFIVIPPGQFKLIWVSPPSSDPLLPGKYRVRLRYHLRDEERNRTVYSDEFSPP